MTRRTDRVGAIGNNDFFGRHQEAAEAARGYVPAAAHGEACEDGLGGRQG